MVKVHTLTPYEFAEMFAAAHSLTSENYIHPDYLYRYRSCSTPYFADEVQRAILRSEFYWPSREQLNDPFDCQPVLEKGVSFEIFEHRIVPVLTAIGVVRANPGRATDSLKPLFKRTLIRFLNASRKERLERYETSLESMCKLFDRTRLFCSTRDINNVMMWSMYGDRGNGIAYEHVVPSRFKQHPDVYANREPPIQVRYKEDRLSFDYRGAVALALWLYKTAMDLIPSRSYKPMLIGAVQFSVLWTKHVRWSYEEEYRAVMFNMPTPHQRSENISAVYLGHRVEPETVQLVRNLCARAPHKLKLFCGALDNERYRINFRPIDI